MLGAIIAALLAVMGWGLGLAVAVATRRYLASLVGGALGTLGVYVLYILVTGEGAPFVPYVMTAGAVGASVFLGGFVVGVLSARELERRNRSSHRSTGTSVHS